ncbi:MAG TPA: pyruvate dehydrogenase (acetyl-transferring) E1 component subunit alpha [Longimicrobiales bacterium]|nr:pyruvate dehydrogenase (acetyl-transferring) E1 component subunit alpha [Longimicrobiales bacterium]
MAEAATKQSRKKKKGNGSRADAEAPDVERHDKGELHRMLRLMLLGRRFEEKCAESYALGKIGGFCHLYIGQEAVGIGAIAALREDDYVITAYRDHVQALAKGMTSREVMAELYGRADGCSGGKGGSMHLYSKAHNFMGGWGIVGGQIPMAVGLGWAARYRGEDRVTVCFFGEAAVNQGAFHEALNMAALWKLPVVFVVENNRFGMGTAWERVSALYDISQKAHAYAMPAAVADGMHVLAMRRTMQEAIDRAREDGTPTLVEARCYRFMGHSMSDPVHGVYRTKEDVEEAKEKDPIRIYIDELQDAGMLSDEELDAMDEDVRAEVDDAAEFADASPDPAPEMLHADVYAQINEHGRLFFDWTGPGGGPELPRRDEEG